MTDYSDAFRADVNAQDTRDPVILVTIEHPDLPAPLRLNNSVLNIESRGETFLASFVEAKILDSDPERTPQAQLTVSNIDRTLVAALRATATACLITLEIIRRSDPDTVERSMSNLELRNVQGDELVIQGDLIPRRLRPQKAIDYYFSPTVCPGLF